MGCAASSSMSKVVTSMPEPSNVINKKIVKSSLPNYWSSNSQPVTVNKETKKNIKNVVNELGF